MADILKNSKARHDFHILETFEAGIALHGTEVKALRAGKGQIADAFARMGALGPEQWLVLPAIVGQWQMGPYGTPIASLVFLLVFGACGRVAWRLVSRWRWRVSPPAIATLAVIGIAAVDMLILSFR